MTVAETAGTAEDSATGAAGGTSTMTAGEVGSRGGGDDEHASINPPITTRAIHDLRTRPVYLSGGETCHQPPTPSS